MTQIHSLAYRQHHGGNLNDAIAQYGGQRDSWIDLSTGISPYAYPVFELPTAVWQHLPERTDLEALTKVARHYYQVREHAIIPLQGAQQAINYLPMLLRDQISSQKREKRPLSVGIVSPTYNEYELSFRNAGWNISSLNSITQKDKPDQLDALVVVNPNNPDGRLFALEEIGHALDLGLYVIVDESFMDPTPSQSAVHLNADPRLVILKSFGKFFGLAGLRLGFMIASQAIIDACQSLNGAWPIHNGALQIGIKALSDTAWHDRQRHALGQDIIRLDKLMQDNVKCQLVGKTTLFATYQLEDAPSKFNDAPSKLEDASSLHAHLATGQIWSRIFDYNKQWIRLGLPGNADSWARLQTALKAWRGHFVS